VIGHLESRRKRTRAGVSWPTRLPPIVLLRNVALCLYVCGPGTMRVGVVTQGSPSGWLAVGIPLDGSAHKGLELAFITLKVKAPVSQTRSVC
jgi:hypothetical protein